MPSNEDEFVKSWTTRLNADQHAGRQRPIYPDDSTLQNYAYVRAGTPLGDVFRLPVPWKKADDVTPHIKNYDNTQCLEIEPQNVRKDCPYTCQCEHAHEDDYDKDPPFPGSKPYHYPRAEIKDLCSCKQVVIKEHEPCPPEPLTKPIVCDIKACTCPRIPLPLVTPEPRLPQPPVQCECVERSRQKAPTFFKCMQERRQVNIAQLFSQKDQPKPVPHSYTVATTQVELDPIDELKESIFAKVSSTTESSEKSKKTRSSRKSSTMSSAAASTKKKQNLKRSRSDDFTVSTALTVPTTFKESSYKGDLCPCCKQDTLVTMSSADSNTSSMSAKKSSAKKQTDQVSDKVDKSCSTDNRRLRKKKSQFTPPRVQQQFRRSSDESSKSLSKFKGRTQKSSSTSTSKTNTKSTKSSSQNTYTTYFMKGQASSSDEQPKRHGRVNYVDVDDLAKLKRKAPGESGAPDDFCSLKFDNEANMKQIKEIIERETQECKTRLKLAYVDGMYPGNHAGHKTCCLPPMIVPKNMSWLYNTCEGAGKNKPDLGWRPGSIRPDVASILAITKKGKPAPEFSHPPGRGIQRVDGKKEEKSKGDKDDKTEDEGEGYACLAEIDIYKKRIGDENEQLVTIIEDEDEDSAKDKPVEIKPTLHMHKTHGQFFFTLHPTGKGNKKDEEPKPGMQDSVMLTFDPKALDTDAPSDSVDDDTTTVSEDSMEMDFTSALQMYKRRDPKQLQTVQTTTQTKHSRN